MLYRIVPVTAFEQNCTLLWCPETREAAIVDPGGDSDRIRQAIATAGIVPTRVLLTHGHIDHVGAAATLAAALGVPIIGPHRDDAFLLQTLPLQGQMFGLPTTAPFTPDEWLADGETLVVGRQTLSVVHCPGHTPGHIVFVDLAARLAQVGDVLFAGSIGRTDFPRGDHRALIESIRRRLFPLGDDIRFIPGHGPMSTFGEERRSNPFVGAGRD
ncbi:Zn-dependent hydrolase, glyoxylase [Thioflavicoccus mobilis 8321]|uniref:Zn-dependent hydrolase, glyoxylase n=1 Tax=Thioflavicoccus mobilis 8321 TaxID=765912 RepID=L0GZI7_9GAMM|nr:MBL fold metallo-hydrolase [Thioflavicoccus mobilis]AGA90729.1 Zn-dependent hydrolase, glyoxylase [Thioflavicoccus mobilis 8321]